MHQTTATGISKEERTKLNHYLYNHVFNKILQRGNQLFKSRDYDYSGFDESTATHVFELLGKGDMYEVTVTLSGEQVHSSCTCPYDSGGLCKHEVAVCLALLHNKIPEAQKEFDSGRQNSFQTTELRDLSNKEMILTKIDQFKQDPSPPHSTLKTKSIAQGEAVLQVTHDNVLGFFQGGKITANVTVTATEDDIALKCDCYQETKNVLCSHEKEFLHILGFTGMQDFFDQLLLVDTIRRQAMEMYGVQNEKTFQKQFEPVFSEDGIDYFPKDPSIVPLSKYMDWDHAFVQPVLHNQANDYLRSGISYVPNEVSDETRDTGFALSLQPAGAHVPLGILPMSGKLNKAGTELVSKFESLEVSPNPDLAYACQEFPPLNEDVFGMYSNEAPGADDEKTEMSHYHTVLQHAFPVLAQQMYLYRFLNMGKPTRSRLERIQISTTPVELTFVFQEEKHYFCLQAHANIGDTQVPLKDYKHDIHELLFFHEGTLYLQRSAAQANTFAFFLRQPEIRVSQEDWQNFYDKMVRPLSTRYQVSCQLKKSKLVQQNGALMEKKLYLRELDQYILFEPVATYEQTTALPSGSTSICSRSATTKWCRTSGSSNSSTTPASKA
ncbi:MAG: hypothetical protein BRD50_04070 [Bacteroidetes bacterium SW_11_45_7]|nr:MAG: hypothetical protein BRD50_04070 [Bacteroidetes bacterium SW_11_45_7]